MSAAVDVHVHIVGNGKSGSGCLLDLRGHRRLFARVMVHGFGLPQSALYGDLDTLYAERLYAMLRSSSLGAAVILAHDYPHTENGERLAMASFFVPNSYVLSLGKRYPGFLPAISLHPARPDALDELDRCIEQGAAVLKLLPNVHNVDCSLPRYRAFWEKLSQAGIPFLAHTGGELSLPALRKDLQSPECLRLPLECGVNVIAAHFATSSHPLDKNYSARLEKMMDEYRNLYADNSALNSPHRSAYLRAVLQSRWAERLIHGSDLPIPVSGKWAWLRGVVSRRRYREIEREGNVLERDYQLKRAAGFDDRTFTRLWELLPERCRGCLKR